MAKAFIEKKKSVAKNNANLQKMKGMTTDIAPYGMMVKDFADNPDYSPEEKFAKFELLKDKRDQFDMIQDKIISMVGKNGQNLSKSIDPALRSYLMSWAAGDFNEEITIKRRLTESDTEEDYWAPMSFPMNFVIDTSNGWENMDVLVVGPDGDHITIDELSNLLNEPTIGDGAVVTDKIGKFIINTTPTSKGEVMQAQKFDTLAELSKKEIHTLIERGDVENEISARNVQKSFMFDEEIMLDGEESFLKWYFESDNSVIPDEFRTKYEETIEKYQLGEEVQVEMMNILATDLFHYDDNIVSDLKDFIDYLFEKQKNRYTKQIKDE